MGGLGKTRLSLQIAADMMDAYPDGVWFLDLAPIRDPSLVPNEAAQVLGVREEPGKPLTQTLCAHLKSRKALLIFDNCEQVVSACATLANALLRAAPDVRIIASSREALRVPGEQVYPVLPLALPDPTASVETLSRSEAVQLFMDRAQLQKPGFALTEREAPAVAELCARLEGIPLALELAAARMRSLSIQEINKRLHDRFELLTGGGRVLLERQQTLRALVAWSYDLLTENEQRLLERLGVFAGGFELEAAEDGLRRGAARAGGRPRSPDVARRQIAGDGRRGGQRLALPAAGDDPRVRARVSGQARGRGRDRGAPLRPLPRSWRRPSNKGLQGPEQAEWTRRVEAELDNLRAAINLALEGGTDPVIAVKIEVALMGFRLLRGYSTEGRKNVRAALALPAVQASDVAHAHALYVGAVLADNQSDYAEARRMLEACLAAAPRSRQSLRHRGDAVHALAGAAARGRCGKRARMRRGSAAIFRQIGDRIGEAIGLSTSARFACTCPMTPRPAGISSSAWP